MLISFWLCVHLERFELALMVYEQDPILEKILNTMRRNGADDLEIERDRRAAETGKGGKKTIGKLFQGANTLPVPDKKGKKGPGDGDSVGSGSKTEDPRSRSGKLKPSGNAPVRTGFEEEDDMREIRFLLQKTQHSYTYNTNVMRIALNLQEEKIASILVANYHVLIDEEMILRAVKTAQLDYLYCIFAYNKNYQDITKKVSAKEIESSADPDGRVYKTFTLDLVFKKLIDYGEDQAQARVRQVAGWKIKSTENILRSLLQNNMDTVAR